MRYAIYHPDAFRRADIIGTKMLGIREHAASFISPFLPFPEVSCKFVIP